MDKNKINDDVVEIDLQRLMGALISKSWLIGISALVCAAMVFLGTFFFVTPQYQSTAKFYVNNSSLSNFSDAVSSITTGDISASRGLVKTYIVILKTRETLNDVIDYSGVQRTYGQLKSMITAESVDSTEIFQVVVTSPDPQEAEKIANGIAYILPNRIKDIVDGTSAKVVEAAVVPSSPSSPNYVKNTMIGFLAGLLLMAAVVIMRALMDITIRTEDDISQSCKYPVLAAVPDMEAHSKGGYGYGYGYGQKKSAYSKAANQSAAQHVLTGPNISFAASEAYKLLRTKLQFSFVDEQGCRVIGVSSALTGEGKTLSTVNLAYTLSQLGGRVLLIDCDMRRPSVADKLPVKKNPGLSEFLSRQITSEYLVQPCGLKEDTHAFHVISAGRNPPNPMELLSSRRMEEMIQVLRKKYDYILLDLPPVCEVSDPLTAAKLADGMLLVVRQNYCDRLALGAAVGQFDFVDTKILGVIFNCTTESSGGYGKRYYNKKYYRKYYQQYYRSSGAQDDKKAKK